MLTPDTLDELYAPVSQELAKAREIVASLWGDALALVNGPSIAPPKTGGKMLRPALCLLAAGASGSCSLMRFADLAASFELLHLAALTHDDVVDRAGMRRGAVSLNALWDDRTAVLSGDYLVSRAMELLARFDSCSMILSTVGAVRRMTEGELAGLAKARAGVTEQDCLRLAEQKTATLFAAACTAPTYIDGIEYRDALHKYGMKLGVAFQLIDDVLDIAQNENALGKPSCGDIAQGKITLPILFMCEAMSPDDRRRFDAMSGRPLADDDRAWITAAFQSSGARVRAEKSAREYAEAAQTALNSLPESDYRQSMAGLAEFVLVRGS